jgi:enamine deaminase RidA (YjgF/YER057c/UK114 family)
MGNEYIQPPEIFASKSFGYTQVVKSSPGALVSISGQAAFDSDFKLVGESDIVAQAEQALSNLRHALRAAGAEVSDLASLRIYIVDYQPEQALALGAPLSAFLGDADPPAQTLIGVQALGMPGMLIEIEATAVISEG